MEVRGPACAPGPACGYLRRTCVMHSGQGLSWLQKCSVEEWVHYQNAAAHKAEGLF